MNKAKNISIRDVAKKAGVSPGTVSNFLNKSAPVHEQTKERIQKAIAELGYQRNELASSLRRAQSNTIGLILPDIRNPFYSELYYLLEQEAALKGYHLLYANSDYNQLKIKQYVEVFTNRKVDALIVSANYSFSAGKFLTNTSIPVVLFEPADENTIFSSISIDNIEAGFKLVDYLINKGHSKIAVITSSRKSPRFKGYQKALKSHNIQLDNNLIHEFGQFRKSLFMQGYNAMNDLRAKSEFTACFVIADMLAIGAISALQHAGIKVPEEIAIAGFDNIPFSEIVRPSLTTVEQPVKEMAKAAIEKCIQIINQDEIEPNKHTFPTKIIERESV